MTDDSLSPGNALTKLAGGTVAALEVMVVLRLLHIVCVLDTATIVAFELVCGQVGRHRWRFKRKGDDARKGDYGA